MNPNLDVMGRLIDEDTLNLKFNIERYLNCEMREISTIGMIFQSQINLTNINIRNMITKIIILEPFLIKYSDKKCISIQK